MLLCFGDIDTVTDKSQESNGSASRDFSLGDLWLPALVLVFTLPYLLTLDHYFFQDDFLILYAIRDLSFLNPLPFFSLEQSVFFYRPLGMWALALVSQSTQPLFGILNPLPFNMLLLLLWLLSCLLLHRVARLWLSRPAAALTLVFYLSAASTTGHLFLWVSTLPSAIACCLLLGIVPNWVREMQREQPRTSQVVWMSALLCAAFLMKESYLGWIVVFIATAHKHLMPSRMQSNKEAQPACRAVWAGLLFAGALGVAVLLVSALHGDTPNAWVQRNYQLAPVSQWPLQVFRALSGVCLPFFGHSDRWHGIPIQAPGIFLVKTLPIIPLLLLAWAAFSRNCVAMLGLLWASAALVPTAFNPELYLSSRYLHAASFGMSLCFGALLGPFLDRAVKQSGPIPQGRKSLQAMLVILFAVYLVVSLGNMALFFEQDRAYRATAKHLVKHVVEYDRTHPADRQTSLLFLVQGSGVDALGLEECVRLATGREDVSALRAEDFEALNTHGFYTQTYAKHITLNLVHSAEQ